MEKVEKKPIKIKYLKIENWKCVNNATKDCFAHLVKHFSPDDLHCVFEIF